MKIKMQNIIQQNSTFLLSQRNNDSGQRDYQCSLNISVLFKPFSSFPYSSECAHSQQINPEQKCHATCAGEGSKERVHCFHLILALQSDLSDAKFDREYLKGGSSLCPQATKCTKPQRVGDLQETVKGGEQYFMG